MDKIFSGKVWTFGNDIDTDTIIPGKRGTIPTIEEMKKYAFELLKPEFGSTVQPGDILIAGTNFGCGSSREQAATVLSHNGVRCIIAKSFARIFFRNAFNSGILLLTCDGIQDVVTGGDIVTVDVDNHTVSANGQTFTVGAVPENLFNIVANGGLIADTRRRLAEGVKPSEPHELDDTARRRKGFTLAEKLLRKNAGVDEVKPGCIATATDSHTTTYGGAGNFCSGIGTAERAAALITGELWFKVPEAIKIVLNGHLPNGVLSKDVILKILGDIKADGGQYKSLEFTGPAAHEMSMMARFTVANMALEAGAKCGLFEADEKTAEYYGMPLEEIDWVCVDDDAHYEKVLTYDVSELEPQLSCPQGVDNVHPLHEVLGTPIDEVYLGSCTNGSIEDLAVAAELMKGKHVPDTMRFIVVPATNRVFKEAIERGYIKTFIEAGAVICHPCCGLCCGMPYGLMYDDERILSTANRNFIGRQGTKKTLSYLCSPAVAAATALAGVVSDPRTL